MTILRGIHRILRSRWYVPALLGFWSMIGVMLLWAIWLWAIGR